ncbi:MAG: hypothetical protein GVY02_05875 [Bacteroidetes bacterium]|jgi:hypothetical protein|nr:hypothetical protein [Bacteroidota bacterium]
MKFIKLGIILATFICCSALISETADAQPRVTFNLNLQPQLKDSVFIPGRDRVELTGNSFPFMNPNNRLRDTSTPKDSVYSITLRFSSRDVGNTYEYNYVLYIDGKPQRESLPRQIRIRNGNQVLDPFYFDAFAW